MADLEIVVDLVPAFRSSPPLISKHHVNLQKWFDDVTRMASFREICDVTKLKNGNGNSMKRTKPKNSPVVEPNPLKVSPSDIIQPYKMLIREMVYGS